MVIAVALGAALRELPGVAMGCPEEQDVAMSNGQLRPHPGFENVPARVEVEVTLYRKGDTTHFTRDQSGTVLVENPGYSVTEFRQLFGGDETSMTDCFKGASHSVSIAGHDLSDPDNTMVLVSFRMIPLIHTS